MSGIENKSTSESKENVVPIYKKTPAPSKKADLRSSQAEIASRKRNAPGFDATSTAKKQSIRQEKLIMEEPESDEEPELDYEENGHMQLEEGDILANRYEIGKLLGCGVYGAVYLATDNEECEKVALKIGRSGDAANKNSLDELKFTGIVKGSPNCIKLLDHFEEVGPHGKHHVLVYEILGPNLHELLYKSNQPNLSSHRLKHFLKSILKGLVHIHDECHLIHSDLKPANLLLTVPQSEAGTSSFSVSLHDQFCMTSLKIGDFGLTCSKADNIQWAFQTCAYRAPESFLISNIFTPVDMWSLGCIAFEMATQEPLFPCCHVNLHQEKMSHLSQIASELGPIEAGKFEISDINRAIFSEVFGRRKVFCGKLNTNLKLSVKNLAEKSELSWIESELFLDFLMMLLKLDAKERMTAKEALNHPFLMS